MVRTGKVVKAQNGTLSVCFERPDMCQHCGACGEKQESLISLQGEAQVGDIVQVDMPEGQLLRTSAAAYLVPVLALLSGLGGGQWLFGTEAGSALCGLVLLALSLTGVVLYDRHIRRDPAKTPRIKAIYKEEDIS